LEPVESRGRDQSESQSANPGCSEEDRQLRSGQAGAKDPWCGGEEPYEAPRCEDCAQQIAWGGVS
jgi:hypothetical protein